MIDDAIYLEYLHFNANNRNRVSRNTPGDLKYAMLLHFGGNELTGVSIVNSFPRHVYRVRLHLGKNSN